jgi:type IV pilus assembly protein PilM
MNFFRKKIISFDPQFIGLDVSNLSVKAFQIERDNVRDKIRSFSSVKIKNGTLENGKIIDKDEVVRAVKEVIEKAGPQKFNTKKVVCSLSESKVFLRIINIPKMEETEAQEAVKWEMEANIPLSIDSVYFDWQFISGGAKNMQRVLTVAISREIVDDLVEVLEKAGLEPYIFEVDSIASVRSLLSEAEENVLNLIVDMGATKTSFIVVENGIPCFTSSIPFSSENINDVVAKRLGLSDIKEAEKMKVKFGLEDCAENNPIQEFIRPVLENFIVELEKTSDFYISSLPEVREIDNIILCGGGASLKGLVPYLVKRLRKNVEIGDPWVNLNLGNNLPPITREEAIKFSTAIGLALRGLDYED